MSLFYYFEDGKVKSTDKFEEYFGKKHDPQQVHETMVGEMRISTVFIPGFRFIDKNGTSNYYLFETMTFGGESLGLGEEIQIRSATKEEADQTHEHLVSLARIAKAEQDEELDKMYRILSGFDPVLEATFFMDDGTPS